jgi:hypothetical protein
MHNVVSEVLAAITSVVPTSAVSVFSLPKTATEFLVLNFSLNFYSNVSNVSMYAIGEDASTGNTTFTSENITNLDSLQTFSSSMSEVSTSLRFTRFNNPLISYDYKCGNYLGI